MKLSIVTICYNSERTIEKTIQSVLSQTFTDYEYIIIDGKSTDSTLSIVTKSGPKIHKIVSEKDNGIYSAMNKGIRMASGEWVHLLNSDDCYHDERCLESIFSRGDHSAVDILACAIKLADGKGNSRIWTPEYRKKENHYFFPHPGLIIRKQFYETHGVYNEKLRVISDAVFMNRNLPLAKYLIVDAPLVTMLNEGVSNQFKWKVVREKIICIFNYYDAPLISKIIHLLKLLFPVRSLLRKFIHGRDY